MATNNLAKLLTTAKKNWSDTVESKKSTYGEFPDGKYVGQLTGVEVKQSSTPAATFGAVFQYLVLEGEQEGQTYTEWLRLFDEDNTLTSFVIQRMEALTGTPAEDLDVTELETIFADAVEANQVWQFTLKTTVSKKDGQEYQNIRLNKMLEGYEAAEVEAEAPVAKPAAKTASAKPAAKPAPKKKVEAPCEVGDEVSFEVEEETITGTVASIDEESEEVTVTVKVGKKSKSYAVAYEDITVASEEDEDEEEEGEATYSEGDEVTFTKTTGKGKAAVTNTYTGAVTSVDEDAEELEVTVTTGKGKAAKSTEYTVAFSEVEPVEADDDDAESDSDVEEVSAEAPAVGDDVTITVEGKEVTGKVTAVDEDSEEISVKVGKKTHTVGYDAIVTEEDEEEDEDAESEDDEDELTVGQDVEFTDPKTKKQLTGKVVSIDNDAETAKIKVGVKTYTVPGDEILILS